MSSLSNYIISSKGDMNEKHVGLKLKKTIIDEVTDMSKKLKLRHASIPEDNFSASVPNVRLINTGRPSKETMVSRKNMMFASIVE
jgi:hypothetical protein